MSERSAPRTVLGLPLKRALPVLGLIVVFLQLSFTVNAFGVAPAQLWDSWSPDGEVMVLKRVEVDLLDRSVTSLGLAAYAGKENSVYSRLEPGNIDDLEALAPDGFVGYRSEAGGYSRFLSFAWRNLGCNSLTCLHFINAGFMTVSVLAIAIGVSLLGGTGLGWCWLAATAFSPWLTLAARNLFWSPWLYYLPALATILYLLARQRTLRVCAATLLPLAFFLKYWGSGYREFITISLIAASMPVLAWLFNRARFGGLRQCLLRVGWVTISSVVGMISALAVHAHWMSGSISTGLRQIWDETVLRRTYGNPSNFIADYEAGLTSNPVFVVWQYIWPAWSTDLFAFSFDKNGSLFTLAVGPQAFAAILTVAILVPVWRFIIRDSVWVQDAVLVTLAVSSTVLWFVAAKGYAYVHTHLLFFVWYLFTIPVLLFTAGRFVTQQARRYIPKDETHRA